MAWQSTSHINTHFRGTDIEGLASMFVLITSNPNTDWDLDSFTKPENRMMDPI